MRIAVTSPLYIANDRHIEFLDYTTKSIQSAHHQLIWIPVENYVSKPYQPLKYRFVQQPSEIHVVEGGQPQSVAKGWNVGIDKAIQLGCDYILVINDDIVLKSNAIDRLVDFAKAHPEFVIWSMGQTSDLFNIESCEEDENVSEHPNFSSYLVRNDFFAHAGKFDENIVPGYGEDNELHGRLAMCNKKAVVYGGARFFHFGSRTINSDDMLKAEMPPMFRKNMRYLVQKFGRSSANEVSEMRGTYYLHPYNIKEMSWETNNIFPQFWEFLGKHNTQSLDEVPEQVILDYLREKGVIK